MTHNKKPLATLLLEEEYETLTFETYWESTRLKNKNDQFYVYFVKNIYRNKNMTSYHRMFNLYEVYKEFALLKMYPT